MVWFAILSGVVVFGVVSFIMVMNQKGEKLDGDEESPPMIWADEEWYKGDGPSDGYDG